MESDMWLMRGDCLERMKEIPDGSVDVVISDIPYGIDYNSWDVKHDNKNSSLLGSSPAQTGSEVFKTRGKPKNGWSAEDKGRVKEFQDFCESWLVEVYRVTKPCSPIVVFTGRQNQHRHTVAAEDVGFIFKDTITWDKGSAPFRAQNINKVIEARGLAPISGEYRLGNLAPIAEPIVWCFKPYRVGGTITDHFLDTGLGCFESSKHRTNLLRVSSRVKDKKHETEKPLSLMFDLVSMFSMEGHTVLDMFSGSNTTGVACAHLKRKYIGIEMDDKHFNIGVERLKEVYDGEIKIT